MTVEHLSPAGPYTDLVRYVSCWRCCFLIGRLLLDVLIGRVIQLSRFRFFRTISVLQICPGLSFLQIRKSDNLETTLISRDDNITFFSVSIMVLFTRTDLKFEVNTFRPSLVLNRVPDIKQLRITFVIRHTPLHQSQESCLHIPVYQDQKS